MWGEKGTLLWGEQCTMKKTSELAARRDAVAQLHSERGTDAPRHATDSVSIPQTHTKSHWSAGGDRVLDIPKLWVARFSCK